MLISAICLSGMYSTANIFLVAKNIQLVKQNLIMTLNGKRELKKTHIIRDDHENYIIRWIDDKHCMKYGNGANIQHFYDIEGCKNYCIENKMIFDKDNYNKAKIEDNVTSKIWMLYNGNRYTILSRMNESEFKKLMIKNNQLPFSKINFILFIGLVGVYVYLNKI